jgi:transposase-like protein
MEVEWRGLRNGGSMKCPYCKKLGKHIVVASFYNFVKMRCAKCGKEFAVEFKQFASEEVKDGRTSKM